MPTVIIYWSRGRTEEQKSDVVKEITETLVKQGGARREDVLIIFQNIEPGDAGRAGHITASPAAHNHRPLPSPDGGSADFD